MAEFFREHATWTTYWTISLLMMLLAARRLRDDEDPWPAVVLGLMWPLLIVFEVLNWIDDMRGKRNG